MVSEQDEPILEEMRRRKAERLAEPETKPTFFQRVKKKSESMRRKQVTFGDRARARKLSREEQKLKIQQVREQRQLSQAKVSAARERISSTKAQTSVTRARAARMRPASSFSVQPGARNQLFGSGTFGVAPATQARRVRRKAGRRATAGRKKQRRAVRRITKPNNNFFGV